MAVLHPVCGREPPPLNPRGPLGAFPVIQVASDERFLPLSFELSLLSLKTARIL